MKKRGTHHLSSLALLIWTALVITCVNITHATAQQITAENETNADAALNSSDALKPRVTMQRKLSGAVPQVECTPAPTIDASSPHIAVDPQNSKHLTVVYSFGDLYNQAPAQVAVVANSYDGGLNWARTLLPGMNLCTGGDNGIVGDPFIALGAGGKVAVTETWLSWDPWPSSEHSDSRLFVSRSSDGGSSFSQPVEPEATQNPNANQRGPVLFDPQFPNRLFVAFERVHYLNNGGLPGGLGFIFGLGGSVAVARSDDAGATFPSVVTAMSVLPGEEMVTVGLLKSGTDLVLIAAVVNDSDFSSAILLGTPVPEHLFAVRSSDSGASFGSPIPIGTYNSPSAPLLNPLAPPIITPPPPNAGASAGGCIPFAAAGPRGSMYVTWTDAATNSVVLARSTDGGLSWNVANALTTTSGALESAVAVHPDGTVGLFYYAVTPDPTRPNDTVLTPYIAVSKDGLSDWTATPITQPFDVSALTGGSFDGSAMGPYQDIVPVQGGFGVVVTLGDGHGEEHVWFVKLSL